MRAVENVIYIYVGGGVKITGMKEDNTFCWSVKKWVMMTKLMKWFLKYKKNLRNLRVQQIVYSIYIHSKKSVAVIYINMDKQKTSKMKNTFFKMK
jgi:TATA-box binding protein (TBP) (component of TFIID and TFIIIB)